MTKTCVSTVISIFALFIVLATECFASTAVFNFDSLPGTPTPFTDTQNGLSATFGSTTNPGGFWVQSSFFQSLTGDVLLDSSPVPLLLGIQFSQAINSLSMDFALASANTLDSFAMTAYLGNSMVGSATATGATPNGYFFLEGKINLTGPLFDRVVLGSQAPNFAIDNVTAQTAAVPEPTTILLLGAGLFGLACYGKRRSKV